MTSRAVLFVVVAGCGSAPVLPPPTTDAGPVLEGGIDAASFEAGTDANGDTAAPSPSQHAIDATFFGLHLNAYGSTIKFGSERVWDAGVSWYALQTGPTTFDFSQLVYRVGEANKYGFDVLYTFGHTPPSITVNNTSADPPSDVAADGSGTDAYVKAFWTTFMKTMCTGPAGAMTCDPIKYFEMWNEPNGDNFFTGTYAQLARMSADSATIIKENCPKCVVLSADVSCGGDGYHLNGDSGRCDLYMASYLDAWQKLGHMPDAGAWHAYPSHTNVSPSPMPETNVTTWDSCPTGHDAAPCTCKAAYVPNSSCRYSILDQITTMRSVFDAHGLAGKPLYVTEGGFNSDAALPDVEEQIAYLGRWYLLLGGAGVTRVYYYAKDTWAPLVDTSGTINALGTAYNTLYDWLVGGALGACTSSGSTWTCPVTTPDKRVGVATWDASAVCTTSSCPTTPTPVASSFTTWLDLAGASHAISDASVPVGSKPILVE